MQVQLLQAVPAGLFKQVPVEHVPHPPEHAVLQQIPPAQNPLAHWVVDVHMWPLANLGTQVPLLQKEVEGQSFELKQAQVPPMHACPLGLPVQSLAHEPQCWGVLLRLVSQPFAGLPSQSAKPTLHETIWHVPLAQVPVPLAGAHGTLQPPQLLFVLSCVSQPSDARPLQSP